MQNDIVVPDASKIDKMPYRKAIDRIATLRALVVRIALNASQLGNGHTDSDQQMSRDNLTRQAETLTQTVEVLKGAATLSDLPEELSTWLAQMASAQEAQMRIIKRMVEKSNALVTAASSEDGVPRDALQAYIAFGQGEFFEAVSELTDTIWDQIEAGRSQQLDIAMQSAARLGEGLGRLERIGKYVRSMSINASVEASRAGEAGKGLAIIAQEFKTLAEEVQQLTLSAREDIQSIEASQ
ncbi:MAG: methyl-accepting chemotaxis protein [Paracoccaceae bacterium]|nr:methyl-accepting chemotaxis protein [Paracoccaceae bacterium]